MQITNQMGIQIGIRVVTQGMKYGQEGVLTREHDEPLIEFYDLRHPPETEMAYTGVNGRFITRYRLETLRSMSCGLALDDENDDLIITPDDHERLMTFIEPPQGNPRFQSREELRVREAHHVV